LGGDQQRKVHRGNPPSTALRADELGVMAQSAVAPEG